LIQTYVGRVLVCGPGSQRAQRLGDLRLEPRLVHLREVDGDFPVRERMALRIDRAAGDHGIPEVRPVRQPVEIDVQPRRRLRIEADMIYDAR